MLVPPIGALVVLFVEIVPADAVAESEVPGPDSAQLTTLVADQLRSDVWFG